MCAVELGTMFSAWATGARPRPTQSDLFNELAICMFDYELSDNDYECEHEIRNCWLDDDCFQEVESKNPSPGNTHVEDVMSCFFAEESCDPTACWLDDGWLGCPGCLQQRTRSVALTARVRGMAA